MSQTTETPKHAFQRNPNSAGSNHTQQAIARLRTTATDKNEAPIERLRAASRLLIDHGPTNRNCPIISGVIKEFIGSGDFSIAERAQKLKLKLAKAKGIKREAAEIEIEEPALTKPEQAPVVGEVASQAVGMPLDFHALVQAHEETFGGKSHWHSITEGIIEITSDERTRLLEKTLGDLPVNTENVRALVAGLTKRNGQGLSLSISFGLLVRVAEGWLAERGLL